MSRQATVETPATSIAAPEERVAHLRGTPQGSVRDGWRPASEHRALGKAERDFELLAKATKLGKVKVETGV